MRKQKDIETEFENMIINSIEKQVGEVNNNIIKFDYFVISTMHLIVKYYSMIKKSNFKCKKITKLDLSSETEKLFNNKQRHYINTILELVYIKFDTNCPECILMLSGQLVSLYPEIPISNIFLVSEDLLKDLKDSKSYLNTNVTEVIMNWKNNKDDNILKDINGDCIVNEIIQNMYGQEISFAEIVRRTSNATATFYKKNIELQKVNEKLQKAIEDKNDMMENFTHRYGNMKADNLYSIANALIQNPSKDEDLINKGRSLILEYENKQMLTKEILMLRMEHSENHKALKQMIVNSIYREKESSVESTNIENIINDALKRILIRVLVSGDEKRVDKIRDELEKYGIDTWQLLEDYELDILKNNEQCLKWINDKIMKMTCKISEEWKNILLYKSSHGSVFLTSLLMELIFNMFTYADKADETSLEFSEVLENGHEYFTIATKNKISKNTQSYSQKGLYSRNKVLKLLNSSENGEYEIENCIRSNINDQEEFCVAAFINKRLIKEGYH